MRPNRFFGVMIFMVMLLLMIGLFGMEDLHIAKKHPIPTETINATNEISEYNGITDREQTELAGFSIGFMIVALAFVYIGGIAYDEYSHIKDD